MHSIVNIVSTPRQRAQGLKPPMGKCKYVSRYSGRSSTYILNLGSVYFMTTGSSSSIQSKSLIFKLMLSASVVYTHSTCIYINVISDLSLDIQLQMFQPVNNRHVLDQLLPCIDSAIQYLECAPALRVVPPAIVHHTPIYT